MFLNSSKILFMLILMMSTMITISANSWFSAWIGLEINLLSFIPLMTNNNLMSNESALKYFLIQALASSILLFSMIMYMYLNNFYMQMFSNFMNIIMMSALFMKTGIAPFHSWFPTVMEGLDWSNSLILMIWQKIAPLILISYLMIKYMMIMGIFISVIVSSYGGLNQTSLRKLMAFSSINHLSWMLTSMMVSMSLWLNYFIFYSILSFNLIFMFNIFQLYHINQLFTFFIMNKNMKFTLFLNFLSLGGLPPFMGFIPKWFTIQYLTMNTQLLIMVMIIMFTLITLFFYLRLCYTAFMINYSENNWITKNYFNNFKMTIYLIMSFISTFGFFTISFFYYLI